MGTLDIIAKQINNNKIGLFPCDTLWGIIGAMNKAVAQDICAAKKRPIESGFIVLIPELSCLDKVCRHIPNYAEKLITRYWPGPLTLILEKHDLIDNIITGNRDTIAVRLPQKGPITKLLNTVKQPIISTSANISNKNTIQNPKELGPDLLESLDFVYDKEAPGGTVASTIVDCSGPSAVIIRQGSLEPSIE